MKARQAFDGKAVVLVVLLVQASCFLCGHVEMGHKVFVDEMSHVVVYVLGFGVEAVVYVEEEHRPVVRASRD